MQRAGVVDDLEEGISRGRAALELCAPQHLDRATSYHDLACGLQRRFVNKAVISDLEESIKLHRAALELRPLGHRHRCSSLHHRVVRLSDRYDHRGEVANLEDCRVRTCSTKVIFTRPPRPWCTSLHPCPCLEEEVPETACAGVRSQ